MSKPRRNITGNAIFGPGDELAALWTDNNPKRRFYVPNCDVDDARYKDGMDNREVTVEVVADDNSEWYEFKIIFSWSYRLKHNLHTEAAMVLHGRQLAQQELNHCFGERGRSCGGFARVIHCQTPRERELSQEQAEVAEQRQQQQREHCDNGDEARTTE